MNDIRNKINDYCFSLLTAQSIPSDQTTYSESADPKETCIRKDLRFLKSITIDCDDTQDMDDAVSLIHENSIYRLYVHIADVSHYVPLHSMQDEQAMKRGTSIYFPFMTIAMLSSKLSDDLCSLNPKQDRRCITAEILINESGEILGMQLYKSLIRSGVKGKYSEVNQILEKKASQHLYRKYEGFTAMLREMHTLSCILRSKRIRNGCRMDEKPEMKFTITNNQISFRFESQGHAEKIIEELMIIANHCVAEYMHDHDLPCIYRIQKKHNEYAEYTVERSRHEDLALDAYVHFTSPIRRLADLKVHQILTAHLSGLSSGKIHDIFDPILTDAAMTATKKSRHIKELCRAADRFCLHEYFLQHDKKIYKGTVSFNRRGNETVFIPSLNLYVLSESNKRRKSGTSVYCSICCKPDSNQFYAKSIF